MIFGTPPIVTNGLVLHLDAGSRQSYVSGSTTWIDLSGNGNNGTLTGSTAPVTPPIFNSNNQGTIVFNGVSSYVDCGTSNSTTFPGDLTVNCWVFPTGSTGGNGGGVVCKRQRITFEANYKVLVTTNTTGSAFTFQINGSNPNAVGIATGYFPTSSWYCVT
jgi:hypothetical protein